MTTQIVAADDAALSAAAATLLFDVGLDDPPVGLHEPRSRVGADAAVEALAACFAALPATVRSALAGAEGKADQLSGDRLQGLAEIIQNADDCRAGEVRLVLRARSDGGDELLVAHDGDAVRLRDVLALATPWLTTKADDADATGRFGIGLMTLRSLAPRVDVLSGPYRLRLGGYGLSVAPERPLPPALDGPDWTVFALDLPPDVLDQEGLAAWVRAWDQPALLFLRSVRRVALADDRPGDGAVLALTSTELGRTSMTLDGGAHDVEVRERICSDGRRWATYTAQVPAPTGQARAHKAAGGSVPLGVAVPLGHEDNGTVHAGLPVRRIGLPVRLAAQFDPLASRQELATTTWNTEAIRMLAVLWCAAALDLFQRDPAAAWQAVPLERDHEGAAPFQGALGAALELHFMQEGRRALLDGLVFDVAGSPVPARDVAFEAAALTGLVSDEETAWLAARAGALPATSRDAAGRWRRVLDELGRLTDGEGLPVQVSVADALPLLEEPQRPIAATRGLWAAALTARLHVELRAVAGVPLADGSRSPVPSPSDPWLLCSGDPDPLAEALGLADRVDPALLEGGDGAAVAEWLRDEGALVDEPGPECLIARLAATGDAGRHLTEPLSDRQAQALRDAFERIAPESRARHGRGVGRAILLQGRTFGPDGRAQKIDVRPADAYLIEKEQDSWFVAAGRTEGLRWLHPRYAERLRSQAGRDGLGAQRFLRLLGAETAPRPRPHPQATHRYAGREPGVSRNVAGAPAARRARLVALGATYTVHDHDCPDLAAALRDIALENAPARQSKRSAALLAALGRNWERLRDTAVCTAAGENYNWETKGAVPSWWVADAAETAWLPDGTGAPRRPDELRLRTAGTVAVYGDDPAVFVHPDLDAPARRAPLEALGVTGDAPASELLQTLLGLRDRPPPVGVAARAAVVYTALSAQYARGTQGRAGPDVSADRLRVAFASGGGLVHTAAGWRTPSQVYSGDPVFGTWRDFVPAVLGAKRLWQLLRVPEPDADACLSVLRDVARRRKPPGPDGQVVVLDTFRLLRRAAGEGSARALGRLSLWTSQGWMSSRPVYAVCDGQLADAIGGAVAVWLPGGSPDEFRPMFEALGVTELNSADGAALPGEGAHDDDELTATFGEAVRLLQVDLALNEPAAEASARVRWEALAAVTVCIAPELQLAVSGTHLRPDPVLPAVAHLDAAEGVLYLRDPGSAGRIVGGGSAVAALFDTDRRRLAQAWLAAWAAAEQGRHVEMIKLASRRVAEDRAAQELAQAEALAALQQETAARRAAPAPRGKGASGASGPTAVGAAPAKAAPPRVLVDPTMLQLVDPSGKVTAPAPAPDGGGDGPRAGRASRTPVDPDPRGRPAKPSGRGPAQYTPVDKETLGLDLLRRVLALDHEGILDLRAQHGVGADAVQDLQRFFELKVHGGPAPDVVRLTDSEVARAAAAGHDFFLVIVSELEGPAARPRVRIISDPLKQLHVAPTGSISMSGVLRAGNLEFEFIPADVPRPEE